MQDFQSPYGLPARLALASDDRVTVMARHLASRENGTG